jgi:hypothetical protein
MVLHPSLSWILRIVGVGVITLGLYATGQTGAQPGITFLLLGTLFLLFTLRTPALLTGAVSIAACMSAAVWTYGAFVG